MPRDAVSRTANVGTWLRKRNGGQKWVKYRLKCIEIIAMQRMQLTTYVRRTYAVHDSIQIQMVIIRIMITFVERTNLVMIKYFITKSCFFLTKNRRIMYF